MHSQLAFGLLCLATAASPLRTLNRQCWHEYPLSTVNLQTSSDAKLETFEHLTPDILGTPNLRPSYDPWSYPPVCTKTLKGVGSKLCVYTDTSFSHGRGISIFTTPSLAAKIATLPAFQDLDAHSNVNVYSGSWNTQVIPGKGLGMLAKRHLKFKDRITAYTPALLAYLETDLPTMEREKFFRIAVMQLPEQLRNMYLQLATVYGLPHVRYQDIVKANTFQLEIKGHNHLAVFPETSRLNHACSPNAQYYLDPERLTHFVHVTRPVAEGEEITISYTSPLEFTDVRQQHLSQGFHFTCTCLRCSAKEHTDATLLEIENLQNSLNDWSESSRGSPESAEKLLWLYRLEGLEGFMDIPYGYAALAYNAIGDVKKASTFAKLAREMILLKDGPWAPNVQLWSELLKEPKKHWSFGRRSR